ncbi:Protein of unknown function [Seinonella peptonophila]|uniref:DUF2815 family protein n=1 Tax=Seinonella peptonophila TaxID=112248 RepID=A0A1M5A1R2_9BACL|nr:DUF2815 family protein [Seinonella peptonophila]SHF23762.1 Protein of unknown function [Seinonella peptonophila]
MKQETKVITGKVRFAYPNVFRPYAVEGQEPKYSICLLIPKSDQETIARIEQAIEAAKEVARNRYGGKLPSNLKTPLRDGDEEKPDYPAFQGHYFLNASSKYRPGIVDQDLTPLLDTTEFHAGCYGRASINFYPYNVSGNQGIAAGLNNLQKLSEGDSLDGRSRAEDEFADDVWGGNDFLE